MIPKTKAERDSIISTLSHDQIQRVMQLVIEKKTAKEIWSAIAEMLKEPRA
ncbi:MAG TPA: hypothetical protein VGU90_01975 [Terriglobales bacterium]|nr:hypothetical protein [Terriglobales bacterium]